MTTRKFGLPSTRPCPVIGCAHIHPSRYLCCGEHWAMVPQPLKDAVWATYTPGQESDLSLVTQEYLAARQAAIEAVNARVAGMLTPPDRRPTAVEP